MDWARNVCRAKKCGFHCKPLIKDEDSDHWWWDWWLRLEIVRSVKTVWATSPILRFHSSPVDSVSGSSVCRGFVNPRELHHLRSNPISEWGFHLQASPRPPLAWSHKSCVRRRESNLQIRSDSPKAPSKDFSSRIHCLAATFSRPDTHSDPDATLCQTSSRGDVDGLIFQFCGDLVDKNIEQGCLLYFWLLLETNQNVAIWGPGTVQRAFALLSFNKCSCQLCFNFVVLHYLFLPPGNSRNFWRPSSL